METIADRAKAWEMAAESVLAVDRPIMVRLDGRAFSTWTKCCDGAWDARLHGVFVAVARVLARETGAVYARTHSDEITLVIVPTAHVVFGARVQKMASSLAALCTAEFATALRGTSLDPRRPATFDCRVWNVPDRAAVLTSIAWRERDATRNNIETAAREHFSHKAMHGVCTDALKVALATAGHPFDALPPERKWGASMIARTVLRPFTSAELDDLPPKHASRLNPDLIVARRDYVEVPPTWQLANADAVIFDGAEPVMRERDAPVANDPLPTQDASP